MCSQLVRELGQTFSIGAQVHLLTLEPNFSVWLLFN